MVRTSRLTSCCVSRSLAAEPEEYSRAASSGPAFCTARSVKRYVKYRFSTRDATCAHVPEGVD